MCTAGGPGVRRRTRRISAAVAHVPLVDTEGAQNREIAVELLTDV